MKMLGFVTKFLFILGSIFSFDSCSVAKFSSPCDTKSHSYITAYLFKSAVGDKTAYCGVDFFSSRSVVAPSGFSYSSTSATYANGATISLSPTITGSGLTFTISPSLPSGVSLNSSTGVISGAYSSYAGSIASYIVTATNTAGSVSYTLTLTLFGKAPIKTLRTPCWDSSGTTDSSCTLITSIGQDGQLQNGTTASFTGPTLVVASDYTTTDNNTGLIWKSCFEGNTGVSCGGGTISTANWTTATTTCNPLNSGSGYANRTDWRLASIAETITILNYVGTNPATYTTNFPSPSGGGTWTSNSDVSNGANAWFVSFTDGTVGNGGTSGTNNLHCVSGTALPSQSFLDNSDNTIVDVNTGLVWQKCTSGLSGTSCQTGSATLMNWATALTTCNSLSLNGRTWRLPSTNELKTLVDHSVANPAIKASYFPSTSSSNYWSSSTNPTTSNAWITGFSIGNTIILSKVSTAYVRCVATGP